MSGPFSESYPPGCCGDPRCQGCAWECDSPDGHDYKWNEDLGCFVCRLCGNESPNLKREDPTP